MQINLFSTKKKWDHEFNGRSPSPWFMKNPLKCFIGELRRRNFCRGYMKEGSHVSFFSGAINSRKHSLNLNWFITVCSRSGNLFQVIAIFYGSCRRGNGYMLICFIDCKKRRAFWRSGRSVHLNLCILMQGKVLCDWFLDLISALSSANFTHQ